MNPLIPQHKAEKERLKQFMLENFCFASLKEAGFYKDIRKTDYLAQAERVTKFFGYTSIYEYVRPEMIRSSPTTIEGAYPTFVNEQGELTGGETFHLDICQTEFNCPICTCPQDATDHTQYRKAKNPVVTIKCKGCKRKLSLYSDMTGTLEVAEV